MTAAATRSAHVFTSPKVGHFTLLERVMSLASRARASGNTPRVIEEWVDELDVDQARWIKRDHPEYELAFTDHIRGQQLRVFVDYDASSDFLGLFVYPTTLFDSWSKAAICEFINKVNLETSYGNLELDPDSGKLRFRLAVDVEGLRLRPAFLAFMLKSARELFEAYLPDLLKGPTGIVQ